MTDARATMAIYRSQKSAWEDALLKHTHPVLVTTSTPQLASLDYAKISLTGVGKKKNLAGAGGAFGVSTILRHVRNERELVEANGGITGDAARGDDGGGDDDDDGDKEEELEQERRKKRRTEKDGDMVLGFDFEKPEPPRQAVAPAIAVNGLGGSKKGAATIGKAKASESGKKKGAIKGGGVSFKGDREKRPQSKAGWWEED